MAKSAFLSSPPPPPPAGEHSLYDDRSAVRPRVRPAAALGKCTGSREDFERKLRFARIVLQLLPASDPRAHQLHSAMLARDAALLDSLLDAMGEGSP
jgi:hypothetical protein